MGSGNTLPEIVRQTAVILQAIAENGGELTPELESLLTRVEVECADKVDGYKAVSDRFDAEAEFWVARAQEAMRVAQSCKAVTARIKQGLKFGMHELGRDQIDGHAWRARLQRVKPSLVIRSEEDIPAKFWKPHTELVLDKAAVRSAIEAGEVIPGAVMAQEYALRWYPNTQKPKEIPNESK
jgi:hypothetical protein